MPLRLVQKPVQLRGAVAEDRPKIRSALAFRHAGRNRVWRISSQCIACPAIAKNADFWRGSGLYGTEH
jgi:hypothetical protein